tara:strand:- start:251 stop:3919 length:3669 start_codon:yes stop_codon:yes gene_type:complete
MATTFSQKHFDASLVLMSVNDNNTDQTTPESSQFVLRFVLDGSGAAQTGGDITSEEMILHGVGLKLHATDTTLGTVGTSTQVGWPYGEKLYLNKANGMIQGPDASLTEINAIATDASYGALDYLKITNSRLIGESKFPSYTGQTKDPDTKFTNPTKYVGVFNKITGQPNKVLLSIPIDICEKSADVNGSFDYKASLDYGFAPLPLSNWQGNWGDTVNFEITAAETGNTHVEEADSVADDGKSEVFVAGGVAALVPLPPKAGDNNQKLIVTGQDSAFTIDFDFRPFYTDISSAGTRGSDIVSGVVKYNMQGSTPSKIVNVPLEYTDFSNQVLFAGNDLSSGHLVIGGTTANIAGWGNGKGLGSSLESGTYTVSLALCNALGQSKYSFSQTVTVGSGSTAPEFTTSKNVPDVHTFATKIFMKTNATTSAKVTKMSIQPIDFSAGLYEDEQTNANQVVLSTYNNKTFNLVDPTGAGTQADVSFIIGNASSYTGDIEEFKQTQYVQLDLKAGNGPTSYLAQGEDQYFKITSANNASGSTSTAVIFGPVKSTARPFEPTAMTAGKLSWDFSAGAYIIPDEVGDLSFNLPLSTLLDASCGINDLSSVRVTTYYDFSSQRHNQDPSAGWLNKQENTFTMQQLLPAPYTVSADQVVDLSLSSLKINATEYIGNDVSYNIALAFTNSDGTGKDLSSGTLDLSHGVVASDPFQFTATANPVPIELEKNFTTIDRTNNVAVYRVNYKNPNIDTSQNFMSGSSVGVKWNLYDISYHSYGGVTASDPSYDPLSFTPAVAYDGDLPYMGGSGEIFTDFSSNENGSTDTNLRFSFRDFSDNMGGEEKATGRTISIRLTPISVLYPQYLTGLELETSGNFQLLDTVNPAANFSITCATPSTWKSGAWDISLSFTGTSGEQYLVTQGDAYLNNGQVGATVQQRNNTASVYAQDWEKADKKPTSVDFADQGVNLQNNATLYQAVVGVPDQSSNATVGLTVASINTGSPAQLGTIGSEVNRIFVQARDASDNNKDGKSNNDYADINFSYYQIVQMPTKTLITDLPALYESSATANGLRVGHRVYDVSQNGHSSNPPDISAAEFLIQSNLGGQSVDELKLGKLYIVNDASTTGVPLYTIDLKGLTVNPSTGTRTGLHSDASAVDVSLQVVSAPFTGDGEATISSASHLDTNFVTRWSIKMPFVGLDTAKNFLYIADLDNSCSEVATATSQKQQSTSTIGWTV